MDMGIFEHERNRIGRHLESEALASIIFKIKYKLVAKEELSSMERLSSQMLVPRLLLTNNDTICNETSLHRATPPSHYAVGQTASIYLF